MAGTWLAVVKGFGGLRVEKTGILSLAPYCPNNWQSLAFKIRFRGALLEVTTTQQDVTVHNFSAQPVTLAVHGEAVTVAGESQQTIAGKAVSGE